MKKVFAIIFAWFFSAALFAAPYYPAASRFGDYQANVRQGVVGGIPNRSGGAVISAATYGFSTGASAATNAAAIISAFAASSEGDVIYMPAGTYAMNAVTLDRVYSNRTLRGAGQGVTILDCYGTYGITVNGSADWGNVFNPSSTITGLTSGSAVITVSDGSALPSPSAESNYRIGRVKLVNEAVTPVVSVNNYDFKRAIDVLMVSRSGNSVTLSQPLPSAFTAGATGAVFELGNQNAWHTRGIGFESFTIDGNNSSGAMISGVYVSFATGCWIKDVKVLGHANYAFFFDDTVNCELRFSEAGTGTGGGTSQAGLIWQSSCYGLVEDNIIPQSYPVIEVNSGSTSNIFGYNFCGTGVLNTNHNPHNSFNLYEGNSYWYGQSDGYFGGSSEETHLRNWMRSGIVLANKRFTRNANVDGNIVGTVGTTYATDGSENWGKPNIGNNDSTGTWSLASSSYSLDWDSSNNRPYIWTGTLASKSSDIAGVVTLDSGMATTFNAALANASGSKRNYSLVAAANSAASTVSGVSGNDVTFTMDSIVYVLPSTSTVSWFSPGPNGFQELDLDVASTTIRKANYYILTGDIPAGESLGADTLPDSYYMSAKPAWFGSLAWPAYDPYSPPASESAALVAIPAGWRYINGNSNYLGGGGVSATATTVNVGTFNKL